MKKWFFLFFAFPLFSAPVGNPSAPKILIDGFFFPPNSWFDLRAGYEGDFVYDGRMKQTKKATGRVDSYKQNTNAGTVTFNLLDRMDIYGVLGSSQTKADWRFTIGDTVRRAVMETRYNFLWAVGARAILYEWGHSDLGFGGRYSSCDYKPAWLAIDGVDTTVSGTRVHWNEWQVDLDLSYNIDLFTPYIGIKYSDATTKLGTFSVPIASNGSGKNRFTNRNVVGVYIGCTLSTGKYFMLNLEGRFVDEEALAISADLRF